MQGGLPVHTVSTMVSRILGVGATPFASPSSRAGPSQAQFEGGSPQPSALSGTVPQSRGAPGWIQVISTYGIWRACGATFSIGHGSIPTASLPSPQSLFPFFFLPLVSSFSFSVFTHRENPYLVGGLGFGGCKVLSQVVPFALETLTLNPYPKLFPLPCKP